MQIEAFHVNLLGVHVLDHRVLLIVEAMVIVAILVQLIVHLSQMRKLACTASYTSADLRASPSQTATIL